MSTPAAVEEPTPVVEDAPKTVSRRRDSSTEEMRVSATSNPQSLASAVSYAIYDNKTVTLRAIGAGAVSQAAKALAIARGFVAPRGFDLAFVPGWSNVTGERGDELSAMTFRVIIID